MIRRFRPYLSYLRPHRRLLFLGIACGVVAGLATGAGLPFMVKKVLPVIFAPGATPLVGWQLAAVILWLPVVFTLRGVAGYLNTYLVQLVGTRVLESIRLDFFGQLQILPLSFLQKYGAGDLLSRGIADTNQLQVTLTNAANEIVKSPATLIGAIAFVASQAYKTEGFTLVLVSLAVVPISVLPIRFIGKKLVRRASQIQRELGAVSSVMSENFGAAREVRAYSLEKRELSRLHKVSQALIRVQLKYIKYDKALTPLIEIVSACGISITLMYAYRAHLDQNNFSALIMALYASYEPIKKLGALNNDFKRGLSALDRLETVLHAPVNLADVPGAKPCGRARGEIELKGLSFAYNEDGPVLRDIDAKIPAGTVCALVGPSGAGKSTFAALVPRFFDPVAGSITLDGVDLRELRMADLRRNIALVSQEPVLFNDTIRENILLARPEATQAEVEDAARAAFAHDFITGFPEGYETVVGERGSRLSGGQKQRIAVARAFLRNAPILILDEATSALDAESEAAIQEAMRKLMVGRTVLIIAHRFSTIRDASLILVFEKGEIVARGPHAELMGTSPLYRDLYERQRGPAPQPA